MSSNYRIGVVWSSQGEKLRADIQAIHGQLSQLDRKMAHTDQTSMQWGRTMRAIGTTIRYAFAGSIVYGVATAINTLDDFRTKLGEINALSTDIGKNGAVQGLGSSLSKIGDEAIKMSDKYGVAVTDILDANRAARSSFDDTHRSAKNFSQNVQGYVDSFTRLMLISEGASADDMGRALASAITATPGSKGHEAKTARRYLNIFSEVRARTPNVSGSDLARDIGQLGAAGFASGLSAEELWGIYITAQRSGGNSAVTARGIRQLLQSSLMNPKTPGAKKAYAAAGLPTDPNGLAALGGMEVMSRLFKAIAPNLKMANPNALKNLPEDATDQDILKATGATGLNRNLLYAAFGRQESVRTFLQLIAQGGPKAIEGWIASIKKAEDVNLGVARSNAANNERFMKRIREGAANFNLQLVRGLTPLARLAGRGLSSLGDFSVDHPNIARGAVVGGIGGAAIMKLLVGTAIGRNVLGRIPGLRRFAGIAGRAGELAVASQVGAGVGAFGATGLQGAGNRSNPFWVVIDPLSWFMPGAPSGVGDPTGYRNTKGDLPGETKAASKLLKLLGLGGGASALLGTAAVGAVATGAGGLFLSKWLADKQNSKVSAIYQANPALRNLIRHHVNKRGRDDTLLESHAYAEILLGNPKRAHQYLMEQQRQVNALKVGAGMGPFKIEDGQVEIILRDPNGKITGTEKVPVRLWNQSGGKTPKHKGKSKTIKAGSN